MIESECIREKLAGIPKHIPGEALIRTFSFPKRDAFGLIGHIVGVAFATCRDWLSSLALRGAQMPERMVNGMSRFVKRRIFMDAISDRAMMDVNLTQLWRVHAVRSLHAPRNCRRNILWCAHAANKHLYPMCPHKVAYIFRKTGEPSVYIINDRLLDGAIGGRDERRPRIKREILY